MDNCFIQELIKQLEDRKERLMSLQNKKIPKCLLTEDSTLLVSYDFNHLKMISLFFF